MQAGEGLAGGSERGTGGREDGSEGKIGRGDRAGCLVFRVRVNITRYYRSGKISTSP